ncbi:hypothetical protein EBZ38_01620 [bacterium]|nr:hypothetical protein [bacterium]
MILSKHVVDNGGSLAPVILPLQYTKGTGIMNPSIMVDGEKILMNIRHINYVLYHSENEKFNHIYGPLQYLHPENDITLTTDNTITELNEDLTIKTHQQVDTSILDVKPLWEFIGLEDARLFKWDNSYYLCGVRRDTVPNGQGRMELSQIYFVNDKVIELSRFRIPTPGDDSSYCEKNWMPIRDLPFHFVKWSNPTEVVKVDPINKTCKTVHLDETKYINLSVDLRGGSQVLRYKDGWLAITHEVSLFNNMLGQKNGIYKHRFIYWDKDWSIKRYSPPFTFMDGSIEFCCGADFYKDDLLISFGYQDNSSYVLKMPMHLIDPLLIFEVSYA